MIFTFAQMYFIFMNSRMGVSSAHVVTQFGLMHQIGTNLCVWLNVLVEETRHEILHFYDPNNHTFTVKSTSNSGFQQLNVLSDNKSLMHLDSNNESLLSDIADITNSTTSHYMSKRGLHGLHSIYECRRTNIFGSLVQNSSQFLFPCTIEYSLICAAILYVMWRSIVKNKALATQNFAAATKKVSCARILLKL